VSFIKLASTEDEVGVSSQKSSKWALRPDLIEGRSSKLISGRLYDQLPKAGLTHMEVEIFLPSQPQLFALMHCYYVLETTLDAF
jgi:hypothetical protein